MKKYIYTIFSMILLLGGCKSYERMVMSWLGIDRTEKIVSGILYVNDFEKRYNGYGHRIE